MVKLDVVDASQPGATLASARQQNALFFDQAGLVVLEIGGNDTLEGLPVARFESDLDQLLASVCRSDRVVVMFELPLPPLCSRYGAAQRRQASKYRVRLIPRRYFASILTTAGSTVDGIHLSAKGQTRMMTLIRDLFGNRLEPGQGTYIRHERTRNGNLVRENSVPYSVVR